MTQQTLLQASPSQPQSQPLNNLIDSFSSSSGLLLLAALGGLIILSFFGESKKGKLAQARWGGSKERKVAMNEALNQIKEKKKDPVALYIKTKQTLYLPNANSGVAVCGSAGVGKTFSVIDPALRSAVDQGFPIILYDFDYPNQTSRLIGYAAKRKYKVSIFAPGFEESCTCNPLDFLEDETDALMARQLAEVLNRNFKLNSKNTEDSFFGEAGDNLLTATFMFAKGTDYPDLLTCARVLRYNDLAKRVKEHEEKLDEWVAFGFGQLISVSDSEKTTGSIQGTAQGLLNRLIGRKLAPDFCGSTTLPLDLEGRQIVVFGVDREKRNVTPPLLAAILEVLVNRNVSRPRREPLVLALDEIPTLYLPSLPHWITQNRKDGLTTMLGFQNLAQIEKAYGKESARTILGSCATKIIFNPQDYETAKLFSDYIGEEEIRWKNKSRGRSSGKPSINTSEERKTRKLFSPEQISKLPIGKRSQCIVINPQFCSQEEAYLPIKIKLRFSNSELKISTDSKDLFDRRLLRKFKGRNKLKPTFRLNLKERDQEINKRLPPLSNGGINGIESETLLKSIIELA